jgi:hypothetical protein
MVAPLIIIAGILMVLFASSPVMQANAQVVFHNAEVSVSNITASVTTPQKSPCDLPQTSAVNATNCQRTISEAKPVYSQRTIATSIGYATANKIDVQKTLAQYYPITTAQIACAAYGGTTTTSAEKVECNNATGINCNNSYLTSAKQKCEELGLKYSCSTTMVGCGE